MNRRQLFAAGAAIVAAPAAARPPTPGRIRLGCQNGPTDDRRLRFFARHGVEGVCGYPADDGDKGYYSVDDLARLRDRCERHGLTLDLIAPPFLASTHVDVTRRPAIVLGRSPERDRDIEHFQTTVRNCARAGVPAVKYNLSLLGVLRTGTSPGRGGAAYSAWRLRDARAPGRFPPRTVAGPVDADLYWERITYFLDRVVPVAAEHRVRLACHPHDPGVPPGVGFQGVDAVLGTVEGLRRFVAVRDSPYHGLNFCVGTVAEMLADPAREVYDVVREFAARGKVFNVHLRNVRGRRDDFCETYPDDGDLDLFRVVRTLRAAGYSGLVMPDHVPAHPDDPGGEQAFAFAYGYTRGLLQAAAHPG